MAECGFRVGPALPSCCGGARGREERFGLCSFPPPTLSRNSISSSISPSQESFPTSIALSRYLLLLPPNFVTPFSRLCHSTFRYRWLASSVCLTQPESSLAGSHASQAPQRPWSLRPGGQSPQMSAPRLIAAAAADKGPVYSGHLVWASPSAGPGETLQRECQWRSLRYGHTHLGQTVIQLPGRSSQE